jgi:glycosyltransferase involved in cell wall biosynthesis
MVGNPTILWVGRLVPDKDPLTAVAAFAGMVAGSSGSDPGPHLWMLATDRDLEAQVQRAAGSRPDLTDRVHVVGPVPHTEVREWFSAAQIYFSTSSHEGSGYALIEALACGCTPVVSDIAPHRAIAAGLGRRFPVGDVEAAASALAELDLLRRSTVRDEFESRLSWRSVAAQLQAAYGLDSGDARGAT